MKRRIAIFDIDGTIFRSSLVIVMFEALVHEGVFPKSAIEEVEESYLAWINRRGDYDDYVWKVVKLYIKHIKGCKEKEVDRVVRNVISKEKDKVYRYTRDLIKDLKAKKYLLLAISASPEHVVKEFAKQIGFDNYFASTFEIINGKFTGNAKSIHLDKKKLIEQFAKDNMDNVGMKGSIGVGDTESDIPLLESVDNPIAFNPNKNLAKHARKMGYKIIAERKDVIYEIKEFKFIDN